MRATVDVGWGKSRGERDMSFHRRKLAHRRAINRIAAVNERYTSIIGGVGSESGDRARAPRQHRRVVPVMILLLLLVLGLLLGLWLLL